MDKKQNYIDFIKSQMEYFDTNSIKEKKKYYFFSILALSVNALIPILSTMSSIPSPYKQIIATLSAIAAISNGLQLIMNSGKNWKHYRDSYTDLEAVMRAYETGMGPYKDLNDEEAFDMFYRQCEIVLRSDRENWTIGTVKGEKG